MRAPLGRGIESAREADATGEILQKLAPGHYQGTHRGMLSLASAGRNEVARRRESA